ncbi:hypothetical protein ACFW4X_10850 [Streptomyces smyrnaeus]|uniref:hypothetical protein n=1 Tax=Streptomyces smyrnaeus TaxID=1387713 RepID=UPI0036C87601
MPRHARTAAALAAIASLALTACSSEDTPEPKSTPSPKTTTPDDKPAVAKKPPRQQKIGHKLKWNTGDDTTGTVTVLSYKQPVPGVVPPDEADGMEPGATWARIDVRFCVKSVKAGFDVRVTQEPWSLGFPDGSTAEVTGSFGGDFPKPEFPNDGKVVRPGRCARGGIMFPIPEGQRPTFVSYAPKGFDQPAEWKVPRG